MTLLLRDYRKLLQPALHVLKTLFHTDMKKGHRKKSLPNDLGARKVQGHKGYTNGALSNGRHESRRKCGNNTQASDPEDTEWCCCSYKTSLPWWLPWIVVMVTVAMRIRYVTSHKSYWILHPDEIYQSVEGMS